MNIKNLIVPVGSLVVVIVALIIGVVLVNKPAIDTTKNTGSLQQPQPDSSLDASIKEADAAYRQGDYQTAITTLEKVRNTYQDQNKKQQADEMNDRIESIKALQKQQVINQNTNKTPAPITE